MTQPVPTGDARRLPRTSGRTATTSRNTLRGASSRGARLEVAAVPATVWAPPAHAHGPAWTAWVQAAIRAAFLPPQGACWDMTAVLTDPIDPTAADPTATATDPARPGSTPVPFWSALVTLTALAETMDVSTASAGDTQPGRPEPLPTGVSDDRPPSPIVIGGGEGTPSAGCVDVVLADLTAAPDPVDGRVGMLAAQVLRGGGILAVLCRSHPRPEPDAGLVDPSGAIVAAAQNADLLYLQHIVIPTSLLRPPAPAGREPDELDTPRGSGVDNVDLLVFAQPPGHRQRTVPLDHRPTVGGDMAPAVAEPATASLVGDRR